MVQSENKSSGVVNMAAELVLHSPVGAEPVVYPWPLTSGSGAVSVLSEKCAYMLSVVKMLWKSVSASNECSESAYCELKCSP